MQSDRRFVEHVQHSHQAGTERRSERNPPGLAAAERSQGAVEREVAQPDGLKVAQPGLHLLEHHPADLQLVVGQWQPAEERGSLADLHRPDFADVAAADPRGQGLGPQSRTAAGRADAKTPPAAQKDADVHLVLPPVEPGEKALQPAELPLRHAVNDQPHLTLRELTEGHVGADIVVARQCQQFLQFVGVGRRIPRRDRPFPQRFVRIGNDQLHVQPDHVAEPFALRARPQRTVETVQPWLRRRILDAAVLAGQLRTEPHPPPRLAVN